MGMAGVAMETLLILLSICIISWLTPTVTGAVGEGKLTVILRLSYLFNI